MIHFTRGTQSRKENSRDHVSSSCVSYFSCLIYLSLSDLDNSCAFAGFLSQNFCRRATRHIAYDDCEQDI